mmetsp:Transcript_62370/g.193312  ORF Transcript_62370/g.193312 Transcript_62370/m.193312 type:complete len:262 (+) Transcript_62370:242-1027(+)
MERGAVGVSPASEPPSAAPAAGSCAAPRAAKSETAFCTRCCSSGDSSAAPGIRTHGEGRVRHCKFASWPSSSKAATTALAAGVPVTALARPAAAALSRTRCSGSTRMTTSCGRAGAASAESPSAATSLWTASRSTERTMPAEISGGRLRTSTSSGPPSFISRRNCLSSACSRKNSSHWAALAHARATSEMATVRVAGSVSSVRRELSRLRAASHLPSSTHAVSTALQVMRWGSTPRAPMRAAMEMTSAQLPSFWQAQIAVS